MEIRSRHAGLCLGRGPCTSRKRAGTLEKQCTANHVIKLNYPVFHCWYPTSVYFYRSCICPLLSRDKSLSFTCLSIFYDFQKDTASWRCYYGEKEASDSSKWRFPSTTLSDAQWAILWRTCRWYGYWLSHCHVTPNIKVILTDRPDVGPVVFEI